MVECVESNNCPEKKNKIVDLDGALKAVGYGPFQYEFLVACAFCILSAGFQNGLSAYLLPAAQCELKMSYSDIGFVNAAFLVGGTVSALFWGVIADLWGRKKVLVLTLFFDFFANVTCCFVQNFMQLTICRFLSGFIIGAPASLIFTFMAEFHTPENRSRVICFSGVFFTIAWLILPVMAWLILSLPINVSVTDTFKITPWRLFLFIMTMQDLITAIWLLRLPESPDFLVAKGQKKKALNVLKLMYVRNTGDCKDNFSVDDLRVTIKDDSYTNVKDQTKVMVILGRIFSQLKVIFQKPLLTNSLLMSVIIFGNMFGYFGLGLWLPEIFTRFRLYHVHHPNSSVNLRQLMLIGEVVPKQQCNPTFDTVVFQNTLAISLSSFLGHLTSGFLAGRINRRIVPVATMLLAGASAGAIYYLSDSLQILMVACVFQTSISIANMVLSGITVEIFPTSVNAVGSCLVACSGRLGAIVSNVLFGFLMNSMCVVPLVSCAIILLLTGLLCLIIPDENKDDNKK